MTYTVALTIRDHTWTLMDGDVKIGAGDTTAHTSPKGLILAIPTQIVQDLVNAINALRRDQASG